MEELIAKESKRTGFRYRRLVSYMYGKYSLKISEDTIKAILRRNKVKKKTRRSYNSKQISLYDYEVLMPFSEFQLDTKHLLDKSALPKEVYMEFCGGSERKLRRWNMILSLLGVRLEAIPSGAKHLMAVVENSHRDDDEYFLMIRAERCNNTKTFLYKAQRWQDTWNFYKQSHVKGMNGLTPYRKLKKSKSAINSHVLRFPVVLMEDLLKAAGIITMFLKLNQTGKYVYTKCQKKRGSECHHHQ